MAFVILSTIIVSIRLPFAFTAKADKIVMYLYIDPVSTQNYVDVLAHAFEVMMPVWHIFVCNY